MQQVMRVDVMGDWEDLAACRAADADLFFAPGGTQEYRAKAVCRACPVRFECLAYALRHRVEHGVWGGLTDRERRKVLNRSHLASWDRDAAARAVS
jgi:WhiB family transcriptional regulator, redox-sensing transcriptional regulator